MKETLLAIIGTAGFTSLITGFFAKGKTNAETAKLMADTYGSIIEDLRTQLNFQGEQLKQQASQLTLMQEREMKFLNIIDQHHKEKKELIEKHALIETELKGQIKQLKTELDKWINKIENKIQ